MSPLNIVGLDSSVGRATGWTVRDSKPDVGEIFLSRPKRS